MKLAIIEMSRIISEEPYCRHEFIRGLIRGAINEIPACASRSLYIPTIKSEDWILSDYEEDGMLPIGINYTITLTPIAQGEDTAKTWEDFFEKCNNWMMSESLYF